MSFAQQTGSLVTANSYPLFTVELGSPQAEEAPTPPLIFLFSTKSLQIISASDSLILRCPAKPGPESLLRAQSKGLASETWELRIYAVTISLKLAMVEKFPSTIAIKSKRLCLSCGSSSMIITLSKNLSIIGRSAAII